MLDHTSTNCAVFYSSLNNLFFDPYLVILILSYSVKVLSQRHVFLSMHCIPFVPFIFYIILSLLYCFFYLCLCSNNKSVISVNYYFKKIFIRNERQYFSKSSVPIFIKSSTFINRPLFFYLYIVYCSPKYFTH